MNRHKKSNVTFIVFMGNRPVITILVRNYLGDVAIYKVDHKGGSRRDVVVR